MRRKLLSGPELAELERAVGLDPSTTIVTVQRQGSRVATLVKELPEEGQFVLAAIAILFAILVCIVTIMAVSAVTAGPPSSCVGHGGVRVVKVGTDSTDWSGMVVCNDGTSYTN